VGFVVDKVELGQVFPEYFGFPLSISFHPYPITRKNEKIEHLSLIFISGLHNKPQGCGASVASAAVALHQKKNSSFNSLSNRLNFHHQQEDAPLTPCNG
jgi:hypothetical protein